MYNAPKKFYTNFTNAVVTFFLYGYSRSMTALKPVTTTCLKEMFEQSNWKGAAKVCLAVIAIFLLIEAFPIPSAGIGSLPTIAASGAVFLFPCSLTLLPPFHSQKPAPIIEQLPLLAPPPSPEKEIFIEEELPTIERPISNAFCSANLAVLGHIDCGPVLLRPSVLIEDYKIPPLCPDAFWNEEGYNIPSCPASAKAILDIGPFPPDIRKDISDIFAFIRGSRSSGRRRRNHPTEQWDRERQLRKLKDSILRILRFGTVQQQRYVYGLFTKYIAPRHGITEESLKKNARLMGKKASPDAFQINLDKYALIPGQVVGILPKGNKGGPPTFALFLRHHKDGFLCFSRLGFGNRLVKDYVKYEQACTFLEKDIEQAAALQDPLKEKIMKKISAEIETNKRGAEWIEELRKLMQSTPPIKLTQLDRALIYHPFYIMWVIPPDQYKENMLLGRDVTEAVVTTERNADMLREWCMEKKIMDMTVFVERVSTPGENYMATLKREDNWTAQ